MGLVLYLNNLGIGLCSVLYNLYGGRMESIIIGIIGCILVWSHLYVYYRGKNAGKKLIMSYFYDKEL